MSDRTPDRQDYGKAKVVTATSVVASHAPLGISPKAVYPGEPIFRGGKERLIWAQPDYVARITRTIADVEII
jgi:hypothetical protein